MSEEDKSQAPHQYSLLGITLARFREAFGEANLAVDHDYQWSMKTAPFASDINVVVHGQAQRPIVWIFDTNDRTDGVSRSVVEHEDAINEIIEHIRARVSRATKTSRKVRNPRESEG